MKTIWRVQQGDGQRWFDVGAPHGHSTLEDAAIVFVRFRSRMDRFLEDANDLSIGIPKNAPTEFRIHREDVSE